jgi:hypothetical protein
VSLDRTSQLRLLIGSLEVLVGLFERDPDSQWLPHFLRCLNEARELLTSGFTQNQLNVLSRSIRSVYGGMRSLHDYYIPGHETLSSTIHDVSGQVWERAMDLIVTGHL